LNDAMSSYVINQIFKLMIKKRIHIVDSKILVLGLSFKENCPDLRNSRVVDLVFELNSFHCHVDVYDPWVDENKAEKEYGIPTISKLKKGIYDAIVIAVSHDEFKSFTAKQLRALGKRKHVLYDIKYLLNSNEVDGRL
jgi:UDP-N-acetyl-D-glucosamine/UDP-N-acetyl-D-galactosamine dehydrogenase